jgi:hypothetical protein
MKFVTSFPLSGNGTDFREFSYTGSSDDISGCWIAVTICVTEARHNMILIPVSVLSGLGMYYILDEWYNPPENAKIMDQIRQ